MSNLRRGNSDKDYFQWTWTELLTLYKYSNILNNKDPIFKFILCADECR